MLAYAASAPKTAERSSNPNVLLAIIAAHVALVAVVMSAKMDLPARLIEIPIKIIRVRPVDPPPPPPLPTPHPSPQPRQGPTTADPRIPLPPLPAPAPSPSPSPPDWGPTAGPAPFPSPPLLPIPAPVRVGAQMVTPLGELKPPYPPSKLASEEEAALQLRLTIDERGRVIAVNPVGRADPIFLAAARRHLLEHWRYKPATEDGRAVSSSVVITLRFQLDG